MSEIKPFKPLESTTHYQGRAFDVRRDRVELPDGAQTELDIVAHVGAVTIVPYHEGQVWFVRQYRHAAGLVLLELPAGTLEADENPDHAAQRELREEIGMGALRVDKIGTFFLAPGYSTEHMHVYLATNLFAAPLESDADEFLEVVAYPLEEVWEMVANNAFDDAKTLAALLLARPHFSSSQ